MENTRHGGLCVCVRACLSVSLCGLPSPCPHPSRHRPTPLQVAALCRAHNMDGRAFVRAMAAAQEPVHHVIMNLPASALDFLGAHVVATHLPPFAEEASSPLTTTRASPIQCHTHTHTDEFHPSKNLLAYLPPDAPRPTVHCYCFSKAEDPTADALQVRCTDVSHCLPSPPSSGKTRNRNANANTKRASAMLGFELVLGQNVAGASHACMVMDGDLMLHLSLALTTCMARRQCTALGTWPPRRRCSACPSPCPPPQPASGRWRQRRRKRGRRSGAVFPGMGTGKDECG